MRLGRRRKPIWITENGVADAVDAQRTPFIVAHLAEVARAIADGVDVRGYLHLLRRLRSENSRHAIAVTLDLLESVGKGL